MPFPTRRLEKKLARKGFARVAGVDEAGRGSWAGPIVAAAVILDPKKRIPGIKDSKLLRKPQRDALYEKIITDALAWSVSAVSSSVIDKIGIGPANILVMQRAVAKLSVKPSYVLTDALAVEFEKIKSEAIIDGDAKIRCIAAASIIAKVTRDRLMDQLDDQYPKWGFKQHKGYGTNHHFHMINTHGVSEVHRMSFRPMSDFTNK